MAKKLEHTTSFTEKNFHGGYLSISKFLPENVFQQQDKISGQTGKKMLALHL